ncbi:MAG TPA: hypothetical protein VGB68_06110 [Pyrinomonadaceae bacterium]|jgi:hypothetical protein
MNDKSNRVYHSPVHDSLVHDSQFGFDKPDGNKAFYSSFVSTLTGAARLPRQCAAYRKLT